MFESLAIQAVNQIRKDMPSPEWGIFTTCGPHTRNTRSARISGKTRGKEERPAARLLI
jgi:hypothetical protein